MSDPWAVATAEPATPWSLDLIQQHAGPGAISSAARSARRNAAVGGSPTSSHLSDQAYDFVPQDGNTARAAKALVKSGVPYDQIIDEGNHVHIGWGPKMRGQFIAKSKPDPWAVQAQDPWSVAGTQVAVQAPPNLPPIRTMADAPAKKPGFFDPQSWAVAAEHVAHDVHTSLERRANDAQREIDEGSAQFSQGGIGNEAMGVYRQVGGLIGHVTAPIGALAEGTLGQGLENAGVKGAAKTTGDFSEYMANVRAMKPGEAPVARAAEDVHYIPEPGVAPVKAARRGRAAPAAPAAADAWAVADETAAPGAVAGRAAKFDELAAPAAPPAEDWSVAAEAPVEPAQIAAEPAAIAAEKPQRAMAEAPGSASDEISSTGYGLDEPGGPVVGDERNPVERVDNAIYRLGSHATADKIEAKQFLNDVPDHVSDPAVQEQLYHAIEQKMVDPGAQIPEHLAEAHDTLAPWHAEQTDLVNRLREYGDPEAAAYDYDSGYVPRRVEGHAPIFDNVPGEQTRDPIAGGGRGGLTKTAQAQKQRTAGYMVTDADGRQVFSPELHTSDIQGRPYTDARPATTAEIEANTDLRYHKNALVNTVDNVLRLRRVLRNREVLEELTRNLSDQGLAHREKWIRPGENGERIEQRANQPAPDDFVAVPHIPQLDGVKFDPRIAEVLRDYYPDHTNPNNAGELLTKVNRALTASLFITPIPHAANVMSHWAVGRGFDWIRPTGVRNLMKTGGEAAREVVTMGPKYREMMREGSGLLYGDTQVRDFHKLMFERAKGEVLGDPKAVSILARTAGLPVKAIRAAYKASSKMLWMANDIFLLQRQLELEAKGLSTRAAIKEAERDIPNYRVPSRVLGSRAGSQLIRNPNVIMFGRYKYGQMRAWGTMLHDIAKGTKHQRVEAIGKALAALTIATVVYPAMDKGVQAITGNKNARVKRAGGLSLTDAAAKAVTGEKDISQVSGSFYSAPPATSMGLDLLHNRDFFGHEIRTPDTPAWFQAGQVAKHVGTQAVYPVQLGLDAATGHAAKSAGKLVGVDLPDEQSERMQNKYKGRDRVRGARAVGAFKRKVAAGNVAGAVKDMGKGR